MLPKKKGFHRHHIIPKHAGGTDDDENLVYLTPEEHAKAHLELYEKYGRYEDAQAYNSLRKYWNGSRTISGYKQSEEHISKRIASTDYSKISAKQKGRISPTKGMKFEYRPKPKISEAQRGKSKSQSSIDKMKQGLKLFYKNNSSHNKIETYCIFCRKRVPPSRLDRHGPGKIKCVEVE